MLSNHYWRLSDGRIWSTASRAYIQFDDWTLYCWQVSGGVITEAADEDAIDDALRAAGLSDLSPLPPRDITPLAFRMRFTPEERLAIHTAAMTVPQVSMWLADAAAAQTIDVLDPATISGIDGLIAAGLITPSRKDALLARGE